MGASRATILCVFFLATTAAGQNIRSAVSTTGDDAAACTIADPCRTFAAAIAQTNPAGEVVVLSSGGYGAFAVTKSLTIVAPAGVHASIAPTSGYAVLVFGSSTDKISLRGLVLTGMGAANGVEAKGFGVLYLDNLTAAGFTNRGFDITPPAGNAYLTDVVARKNGQYGVYLGPSPPEFPSVRATLHRVYAENNENGILIGKYAVATISRSHVIGSAQFGFAIYPNAAVGLKSCNAFHNHYGIIVGGGAAARVSDSYVSRNDHGVTADPGGTLITFFNNYVQANWTSDGAFTSGELQK